MVDSKSSLLAVEEKEGSAEERSPNTAALLRGHKVGKVGDVGLDHALGGGREGLQIPIHFKPPVSLQVTDRHPSCVRPPPRS